MKSGILAATAMSALSFVGGMAVGSRYPDAFRGHPVVAPAAAGKEVATVTSPPPVSPPPPAPATARRDMGVFPADASGLPVTGLPELIAALLPPAGFQDLGWDHLLHSPLVLWRTVGVDESATGGERHGDARVRAAGVTSTRLRKDREELTWTVSLTTGGNPKYGPKSIALAPGGTGEQKCFGYLDDGCWFPASAAFASPILTGTILCRGASPSENAIYRISSPGRRPELLVYSESEGSGGRSASLRMLSVSSAASACAELKKTGEVMDD
jgi:hypothetical protein